MIARRGQQQRTAWGPLLAMIGLTQALFWASYALLHWFVRDDFPIITVATAGALGIVLLLLLPLSRFSRLQTITGLFLLSVAVDAFFTAFGTRMLPYDWLPLLRFPVQYLLLLLSGLTINVLKDEDRRWSRVAIAVYPVFCVAVIAGHAWGRLPVFIPVLDGLALLLLGAGGLAKLVYLARETPALAARLSSILLIGFASTVYDAIDHASRGGSTSGLDASALSPLFLMLGIVIELAVQGHRLNQEAVEARSDLERQVLEQDAALLRSSTLLRHRERQIAVHAERQRFVRDLHDGAGGILTHLLLNVRRGAIDPAEIEAELQGAVDDLRNMAMAMDNADAPLDEALGMFAERLSPRVALAGIALDWAMDMPEDAPLIESRRLLHVYRILQEGVTNILRHAEARRLSISLHPLVEEEGDWVRIMLVDDGRGFAPGAAAPRIGEGRGLANMRHRAKLIDGRLDLVSGPDEGTRLSLSFPANPVNN